MTEAQRKEFDAFTHFFATFNLSHSVSSVADLSDGAIFFDILSIVYVYRAALILTRLTIFI